MNGVTLPIGFIRAIPYTISALDINGRLLFEEKSEDLEHLINLKEMPFGIYLIKVAQEDFHFVTKIIKQ